MHSTLVVFSDEDSGKIVRIQDRPMEEIPDNSLITVSILSVFIAVGMCTDVRRRLQMLRKFNAVVAPKLMGIPPTTEKEDHDKFESRHA